MTELHHAMTVAALLEVPDLAEQVKDWINKPEHANTGFRNEPGKVDAESFYFVDDVLYALQQLVMHHA